MLPSRIRPPRAGTESAKPAQMAVKTFNAPVAGMITNSTLATATSALMLENFWPTPQGIEPRAGCLTVATVTGAVVSLFEHRASGSFFAATATAIYRFTSTTSGGGALTAAQTGLSSGKWSTYEVQNSGGNFLLCVNGSNAMRRFDGTNWLTITGTGPGAITGVVPQLWRLCGGTATACSSHRTAARRLGISRRTLWAVPPQSFLWQGYSARVDH